MTDQIPVLGGQLHLQEPVPCRLCRTPTLMLGTKLCDRCWELETRIRQDPQLAQSILANIAKGEA